MAIEMLRLGAAKVAAKSPSARVELLVGDAEQLPFQDNTFDMVTGAFGVRNFGNIPSGLAEAHRVLKPGGQLLVLDFCEPTAPLFRQLYYSLPQSAALNRRPNFRSAPGLRLSAALGGNLSQGGLLSNCSSRLGSVRRATHP